MATEVGGSGTVTDRPKAETLDLLRGVAALAVVYLHMNALALRTGLSTPGSYLGELGVQLFFVLSGFLITNAVLSRSFTRRSYSVNRVFRILPAYFAALVVAVAIRDATTLTTWGGLKDLTAHVFLVQTFYKSYRTSINPVLWTLSIEWLYYILMLVVARGLRRRVGGWAIVGGMFAGALLYRTWIWHHYVRPGDLNFMYKQLPGMMDQFACGMALALALRTPRFRRLLATAVARWGALLLGLGGIVVTSLLWARHGPNDLIYGYWKYGYMIVLWPLAFCGSCALVMAGLMPFERNLAPWIKRSGLGFVGVCSYSLYLLHPLVINPFVAAWGRKATIPAGLYMAMAWVAVLVVAIGSYYAVERPFMRVRERYNGRGQPPSLPDKPPATEAVAVQSADADRGELVGAIAGVPATSR